jgi:O-antigen ligase
MTRDFPTRIALWLPLALVAVVLLFNRSLLTNQMVLGGILLLEIVLVSLWHYRTVYFPLTIFFFVCAGTYVPFMGPAILGRWPVLAAGALAGVAIWTHSRRQSLTELHLVAFLCIPAAAVSALESNDPLTALLKVASLFLLFLYCATGVRVAIAGRELQFVKGMLLGCEITLYCSAACYAAGWPLWGNPNSLGAVTGVALVPFMLWGFLIAETRAQKYRRGFGLLLCLLLLFYALSRASIMVALLSATVMLIALKRQRLIIEGAFIIVLLLAIAAVFQPTKFEKLTDTATDNLLYKGKKEQGVFGSRQSPWQATVASLKQHPWFGTGFGTSDNMPKGSFTDREVSNSLYTAETNREHGNSYLAMAEYLGFIGMLPFSLLILLVIRMVVGVLIWMRRTGYVMHPAIPVALVMLAGLVHAFFEDWLFAVGYYLSVFFWVCAFILDDIRPERGPLRLASASPAHPRKSAPAPNYVSATR